MGAMLDLRGKRFGRLLVLFRPGRQRARRVPWLCQCDCGRVKTVLADSLTSGRTLSCGCLRNEKAGGNRKIWIEHGGERFFQTQFLARFGAVSVFLYRKRIRSGMDPYTAATTPISRRRAA